MAALGQTFVTKNLPQDTNNFNPLPAGWYDVTVKTSELKPTKAGDGSYINLRLIVAGPTHSGRSLFCRFIIINKKAKAEEIGRAQLRTVLESVGIEELSNTDQLIGAAFGVKVATEISSYSGEMENEIKGFKASSTATPAGMPPQFAQQPSPFSQKAPVATTATPAPASGPWATPSAGPASAPPWAL